MALTTRPELLGTIGAMLKLRPDFSFPWAIVILLDERVAMKLHAINLGSQSTHN
jgi:hypothetical protein